jgi:hypothetical protein
MLRRLSWIALATACGNGLPSPAPIQRNVALHAVTGCPAVEAAVKDAAVSEMRTQLESFIRSGRGLPGMAGGTDATPSAAGGPSAYTTTNVQVAGVDEADIVKNDGTRIFALSGDTLHAAASWPAFRAGADGLGEDRGLAQRVLSRRRPDRRDLRGSAGARPEHRRRDLPDGRRGDVLSNAGIRLAALQSLKVPLATAVFPRD